MSYIGQHPIQTDRSTSGTFQANELIEKQKRGMFPNTHWDMISFVNTRDGDSNIAQSYDFTLPDYDVFFFNIAQTNFQTGTGVSSAEPRIQISEDNGSSFISANYNTQRTSGSQTGTSISNNASTGIDSIRLTLNQYHVTVPKCAGYHYIFNAKNSSKPTVFVGKQFYADTSNNGSYGEYWGANTSTNATTDIRFYTSDIGGTNSEIVLVMSLWGCKNYSK
jgi:hypothetical protein|tara:strand:+ start:2484 stop:3146 length:663 start_codon:yes stop_codon:yes gene_type:complete